MLGRIDSLLGEPRLSEIKTPPVVDLFDKVNQNARRIVALQASVNRFDSDWEADLLAKAMKTGSAGVTGSTGNPSQAWERKFVGDRKKELGPLLGFFMRFSTSPTSPRRRTPSDTRDARPA